MIVVACLLLALVAVAGLSHFFGAAWGSRALKPYVGLFAIAALVAIAGVVIGLVKPEVTDQVLEVAKWMGVATGVALCVHGVVRVFAGMLAKR